MKEFYYIYNNEAIASCVILEYLQYVETLDIARLCLLLPLLLDDRTVSYVSKNIDDKNSTLDSIVKENPRLFMSFNKRYLSLLPITINSILLLNKNKQVRISSNIISSNIKFNFCNTDMGNRFERIKHVIPFLATLLNAYSTSELYHILKVQL